MIQGEVVRRVERVTEGGHHQYDKAAEENRREEVNAPFSTD
jgi:hypothetical protein